MRVRTARSQSDVPHVALIIETSLASGRGVLLGISRYLREHGPWSIYHEPRDVADRVPAWLGRWRGDGIIARIQTPQIAKAVLDTGLPAVDVLGMVPDLPVPLVHADNRAIARLAAEHLLERGFHQFAYCGIRGANWSTEREQAFRRTVEVMGHDCAVIHLAPRCRGERSWEAQQERLAAWVRNLPKPVAIMACNDPRGQMVLDACRRAAMSVPDDVAVIGADNDQAFCEVSSPPLTSVEPNTAAIGYQAANLLEELLRGKRSPRLPRLIAPTGVVVRESTDTLAINDRDVAQALAFIRQHACEPIKVRDVVRRVAISQTVLQQRFRNLLNRTVHDEIIRVRLNHACTLLRQTELSLGEIAHRCAFEYQEYMGVVFRRVLGTTPGQVRDHCHDNMVGRCPERKISPRAAGCQRRSSLGRKKEEGVGGK